MVQLRLNSWIYPFFSLIELRCFVQFQLLEGHFFFSPIINFIIHSFLYYSIHYTPFNRFSRLIQFFFFVWIFFILYHEFSQSPRGSLKRAPSRGRRGFLFRSKLAALWCNAANTSWIKKKKKWNTVTYCCAKKIYL